MSYRACLSSSRQTVWLFNWLFSHTQWRCPTQQLELYTKTSLFLIQLRYRITFGNPHQISTICFSQISALSLPCAGLPKQQSWTLTRQQHQQNEMQTRNNNRHRAKAHPIRACCNFGNSRQSSSIPPFPSSLHKCCSFPLLWWNDQQQTSNKIQFERTKSIRKWVLGSLWPQCDVCQCAYTYIYAWCESGCKLYASIKTTFGINRDNGRIRPVRSVHFPRLRFHAYLWSATQTSIIPTRRSYNVIGRSIVEALCCLPTHTYNYIKHTHTQNPSHRPATPSHIELGENK